MNKPKRESQGSPTRYFPISPLMIFPDAFPEFSIYLKKGRNYLLFTSSGERLTPRHKLTLYENGVQEVYIQGEHRPKYEEYVEQNLGRILSDETLPIQERSKVFYHCSTTTIREIMQKKLPTPLNMDIFKRIQSVLVSSLGFLAGKQGLKALASLMSHNYSTYSHSVNVFIYTMSMLETYSLSEKEKMQYGLGTILHDIGKTQIPPAILNRPGRLSTQDWEIIKSHPVRGVGLCANLPLDQASFNCILFHHEKCDGSGYPAGLSGGEIPFAAKIVAVADVYDALTTERAYAEAMSPYSALTLMKGEMNHSFEPDIIKRLVLILSGADII